ncbi:MAG: hypothetical protein WC943_03185 [Elusimicrobiota bacterium]|jgi:acyl carrier protein
MPRIDRDEALDIVRGCLALVNELLPPERRLSPSPDTVVLGEGGSLDSLALIDLLVNLEEKLASGPGVRIQLIDDSLTADGEPPFRTLGDLADWIVARQPPA